MQVAGIPIAILMAGFLLIFKTMTIFQNLVILQQYMLYTYNINMIFSYIINEYIIIGWFCVQACQDNLNARSEPIFCMKGNTSRWQAENDILYTQRAMMIFPEHTKVLLPICFPECLARISWGFKAEIKKTWNLRSDNSDFVNGSLVTQPMFYRSIFFDPRRTSHCFILTESWTLYSIERVNTIQCYLWYL